MSKWILDSILLTFHCLEGAFLHATTNIYFDGGLFADNGGKDAMISRGDNIVFDGTTFIGQSPFAGNNGNKVGIHLDPVRFKETVLWEHKGYWKGRHQSSVCPNRTED